MEPSDIVPPHCCVTRGCLQDDTEPSDIVTFIEKHKAPLVGQYSQQTKDKVYKDRPLVLFFYTVDWTFEHREGLVCYTLQLLVVLASPALWRRAVIMVCVVGVPCVRVFITCKYF